jgi:hypothetical protein
MRRIVTLAVIATLGAAIGVALADDGKVAREDGSQTTSLAAIKQNFDSLGYDVRRPKVGDGVFKVQLIDRQSGGAVKAIFDLTTGELVRAKLGS